MNYAGIETTGRKIPASVLILTSSLRSSESLLSSETVSVSKYSSPSFCSRGSDASSFDLSPSRRSRCFTVVSPLASKAKVVGDL